MRERGRERERERVSEREKRERPAYICDTAVERFFFLLKEIPSSV